MRERSQMLDDYCREISRDPETLDRSLYYWVPKSDADPWGSEQAFHDVIGPYIAAGVNQFLFDPPPAAHFALRGGIVPEVFPRLLQQTPRPTTQGVTVDPSGGHKPQDAIS